VNRLEHGPNILNLGFGYDGKYIAIKMNHAALSFCLGIKISQRLEQAQTLVTDK
jgi:hypothetical protein